MAAKTIQLGSFCGGTSKLLDSEFLGHETSLNCYPETVETSETYTNKMLKGFSGFSRKYMQFSTENKVLGMFRLSHVADGIGSVDGTGVLVVFDTKASIFYKDSDGEFSEKTILMNGYEREDFSEELEPGKDRIYFCETSGDPSYVIFLKGKHIWGVDLTSSRPEIEEIEAPTSYVTNESVIPSSLAFLNYRIIISEKDSDYIYWSELNKPNGVENSKAFYQMLTRYAYTQSDSSGTVVKQVTFDDNQYYPPSYGSYDTDSLESETVWMGALNNVKVDFKADNVKCICGLDEYFIAFGSCSLQSYKWQNSTNCPYITTGKNSAVGICGVQSLCKIMNQAVFVGSGEIGGRGVYVANGVSVEKISTPSIDQRLRNVKDVENVVSMYYSSDSHVFYVLTYMGDGDNFTICYDFSEKAWHDRGTIDNNGNVNRWAANVCAMFDNEVLFSDNRDNSASIYLLDKGVYTDFDERPIPRERTTGIKFDGQGEILVQSLEIVMNNGSAIKIQDNEQELNPEVMLQVSFDGGFTWSSEKWAKAGRVGQYNFRTIWRNLGKGSKISFRVRFTAAVPFNIATAYLTYTPLKNRIG